MKVAILFGKIKKNASLDEQDTINEVKFVEKILIELGCKVIKLPVTLNLESLFKKLNNLSIDLVFNLVESINGDDNFSTFIPILLESIGIPYTGVKAYSFYITTNKLIAKEIFKLIGIPTPNWCPVKNIKNSNILFPPPYIIKSIFNHASANLYDDFVFNSFEDLQKFLFKNEKKLKNYFIEEYIDGREFNISLLSKNNNLEILPIQEIKFINFSENKPKIVGYKAKWETSSFEYNNTVRTFIFDEKDNDLINELKKICIKCWKEFKLQSYARIDIRVNKKSKPFVLEVNANPCLSPDGGLIASAEQFGLKPKDIIKRIIDDAFLQN